MTNFVCFVDVLSVLLLTLISMITLNKSQNYYQIKIIANETHHLPVRHTLFAINSVPKLPNLNLQVVTIITIEWVNPLNWSWLRTVIIQSFEELHFTAILEWAILIFIVNYLILLMIDHFFAECMIVDHSESMVQLHSQFWVTMFRLLCTQLVSQSSPKVPTGGNGWWVKLCFCSFIFICDLKWSVLFAAVHVNSVWLFLFSGCFAHSWSLRAVQKFRLVETAGEW
jgi:hypothetical protein